MGASLLGGDFDLPASDVDGEDLFRCHLGVGAEEGLRVALALRIPDEDPADGLRLSGPVPQRGSGEDLKFLLLVPVPGQEGDRRPVGVGIVEFGVQYGQGLALQARASALSLYS